MAIAAQSCGRIVGPQTVPLEIVAEKHGDAETVTDETPARKYRGSKLRTANFGVTQRARDVVINPSAEQELEHGTLLLKPSGSPEHTSVGKAAVTPEIGRGEKQKPRRVLAELTRRGRCR